jgi:chromosome partitioning protein
VTVIAIINHKGGVGKTTTAVNLAVALAARGNSTLLVDCDPQAHATRCLLETIPERTVGDLLMDRPSQAERAVSACKYENLDVIGASHALTRTAELLSTRVRREVRLSKALQALDYDYVLLDSAPTEGILTHNVITAADLLLVPVQTGGGAIEGVEPLLELAMELRDGEEMPYRLFLTMFDVRTTRTNTTVVDRLRKHRKNLLKTYIGKSERLNQANLESKPIKEHSPGARGVREYDALAKNVAAVVQRL